MKAITIKKQTTSSTFYVKSPSIASHQSITYWNFMYFASYTVKITNNKLQIEVG